MNRKITLTTKNHKKFRQIIIPAVSLTALLFTGCGSTTAAPVQPIAETASTSLSTDTAADMTVSNANIPSSFTVSPIANNQNTITVNSSETVTLIPDIAEIVYSVRTEAKDAAACQQKNTEDVNEVIDLLKRLGIAETSIQTSDYYMYPVYNYSNNTRRINGYEAATTLTVSDLPIENLGNILTESVNAGINDIQSITYQSSQYDEGYTEALKLAVASAKAKAAALAEAGACSLGGVANIRENSNYSEARYTDNALASQMRNSGSMKEMAIEDAVNIMPGEVDIEVNITVEYFIQ